MEALAPERVVLLPDGVEDLWGSDYLDLVAPCVTSPDGILGRTVNLIKRAA